MTTKTVDSYCGEKQVTKAEFVNQWTQTTHQYWSLAIGGTDGEVIDSILASVKALAEKKWESLK